MYRSTTEPDPLPSSRQIPFARRRRVLMAVLLLALLTGLGYASARISASYSLTVDGLDSAGGPAQSTSYIQVDSALGQPLGYQPASSASYRQTGGIVQDWSEPLAVDETWSQYE